MLARRPSSSASVTRRTWATRAGAGAPGPAIAAPGPGSGSGSSGPTPARWPRL